MLSLFSNSPVKLVWFLSWVLGFYEAALTHKDLRPQSPIKTQSRLMFTIFLPTLYNQKQPIEMW